MLGYQTKRGKKQENWHNGAKFKKSRKKGLSDTIQKRNDQPVELGREDGHNKKKRNKSKYGSKAFDVTFGTAGRFLR